MPKANRRLWASAAFCRALDMGGPGSFEETWKKVNYVYEVCTGDPAGVQRFERVEHLRDKGLDILEIDLHGTIRLLAQYGEHRLTMLAVGGKPIVPSYTAAAYQRDMESARPIPLYKPPQTREVVSFPSDSFFGSGGSTRQGSFDGVEDTTAWLYFLDERQGEVADRILAAAEESVAGDSVRYFLVGPPGTGKTAVLLNVLVRARQRGLKAGIWLSDALARYCELWGLSLDGRRWTPGERKKSWDLLLVDDPADTDAVDRSMLEALTKSKVAVAAFDPLQLRGEITDGIFARLVRRNDAEVLHLGQCYRQRETLGRAAKRTLDALAKSSAYLIEEKTGAFLADRQQLFHWSNDLEFTFAGGQERVIEGATKAVGERVVAEIARANLWGHAPGVLVAVQPECSAVNWPWGTWLGHVRHARISFDEIPTIKGLDFQHVVLAMGEELYVALRDGFTGSGRYQYERRKLMRIPYTRARDSLTVLVVKDYEPWSPKRETAREKANSPRWGRPYE